MTATTKAANEAFDGFTIAQPEAFKQSYDKFAKGMSSVTEFQKAALEALMASTGTLTRGVERAASDQSAFLKAAYEDGVAVIKATASSKSLQEVIDIQSEYVRTQTAKNLSQFSKLSEHWVTTAKEVSEPLTEQYGALVERVQAFRP